jgi:hypothetical protein
MEDELKKKWKTTSKKQNLRTTSKINKNEDDLKKEEDDLGKK